MRGKFDRIDPAGSARYCLLALYPHEHMPRLDEQVYALLCEDADAARQLICMRWKRMLLILRRIDAAQNEDEELK